MLQLHLPPAYESRVAMPTAFGTARCSVLAHTYVTYTKPLTLKVLLGARGFPYTSVYDVLVAQMTFATLTASRLSEL